jgi:hypothetical protein
VLEIPMGRVSARRLLRREQRDRGYALRLEYAPTADLRSRWGYGRPSHARLAASFASREGDFAAEIADLATYVDDLARFRAAGTDGPEPCWLNEWLVGLDTVSLYGYTRRRRPARYIEIGSGQSTKVVARARRDGGLSTHITSVDPHPRADIDGLCDDVIRQPLELADLARVFAGLRDGDVVFFDGSHRVLPNSDCVAFFLDVLPELPPGVLIGVHDVYLPDDYPDAFLGAWWSEQYALAAMLLGEPSWMRVVLPCFYVSGLPGVMGPLDALWREPALDGVLRHGSTMWLATRRASR